MSIRLSKIKVLINIILFVLFMVFAIIQLNDPDPLIWFTIYFVIALVCLLVNFMPLNRKMIIGYIIVLAIHALFHFNYLIDWLQTDDKAEILGQMIYEKPYLEGSREFIGLFIGICGLIFVVNSSGKK